MYTTGSGVDPQQYLSGQRCSRIQMLDNNWADGNNARACSAEYDEVFEQLEQSRLGTERDTLVKQLNDIIVRDGFEIPLVARGFVSAHSNTLKGVRINGWDSELWNIAEWSR